MFLFRKNYNRNIDQLPSIDKITTEMPAISEYLDAFKLPYAFKQAQSDTLPVINEAGLVTGIVSEYDLARILPDLSLDPVSYRSHVTVGDIMTRKVWAEPEHTNIAVLLSSVGDMHTRLIPVVDNEQRYTGKCITRTALISYLTRMVKPYSIGGLATPLGVYMTDGKHMAGSKMPGLVLTGITFGIMVTFIQIITGIIFRYVNPGYAVIIIAQLALFILFLRLTPFVKYHAAEHQTIHAIEKGLPLNPETVRMQPRAHKRCGTNLMMLLAGVQIVLLLSLQLSKISLLLQFIFLVAGFMFVFSNWRRAGMWIQKYFTTAKASDKQINNAINVGEEILSLHKQDTSPNCPNIFQKVWYMGIIQILAGFLFILWLFDNIINHL